MLQKSIDLQFGNDTVAGGSSEDIIWFANDFNQQEYTIGQKNDDLVIFYQQAGMSPEHTLTVSDWFATADHIETVQFGNASYSISNVSFQKQA